MAKKLKVVMIARHCCIRVQKQALPLLEAGYDVHCIAHKMPMFGERYKSLIIYQDLTQLYQAIKLHKDADIFHCHNEPSWFVTAVKSVVDKPTILDAHDSMLIRVAKDDDEAMRISIDERNNFQLADGHIFVSQTMADICREEFGLEQPHVVLPSYVPMEFHRLDAFRWLGGITYEGRIDLPDEIGTNEMEFFRYCEYTELAKELHGRGIPFHLYTPRKDDKIQKHFGETAAWRGCYTYDKLIRKVARHNWGILGNIDEHLAWQHAMPNKLFEYMAAGIPIIAMNAKLAGEFVEEHGFGIAVKTVDEIVERWGEHRECRKNLALKRFDWAMEQHIDKVKELYETLI